MTDLTVEPLAAPDPATTNWVPVGPGNQGVPEYSFSAGGPTVNLASGVWATIPVGTSPPSWSTPSGAFTVNADGSVTVRDAGYYSLKASLSAPAFAGGWVLMFASTLNDWAGGYGVNASGSTPPPPTSPYSQISADLKLNAGAKVYVNAVVTQAVNNVNLLQFAISRIGSGQPGPVGPAGPGTASYGTTLPASPYDGQEAILVDSITNPTYQWRFRYNAGSTSPYKWEFVGGAPWFLSASDYTPPAANQYYVDSATGSTLTIPRPGEYMLEATCDFTTNPNGVYMGFSYDPNTRNGQVATTAEGSIYLRTKHVCTNGEVIANAFYCVTVTNQFSRRTLSVLPARVS